MLGNLTLLGLAAMGLGSTQVPPGDSPSDSTFRLESIVFVSERGDSVAAERGHLRVPENRGRPAGRTIELTFVSFRSTRAERRKRS